MSLRQSVSTTFGIRIIDEATGRGVPLVELETVHHVLFVTDSAGWVAISEPGLMNNAVFFFVRSHGYTFPKDGFGYAGVRLILKPGGRADVKLRRLNIAERVCRLTGEGIYNDSVLLGERTPLREPLLASRVVGQDSALAVVYRGKMLWFWGDTSQPGYPLGSFRTSGAIATFPNGQNSADAGLDFSYFSRPDGFVKELCPSKNPGPIWISGVTVLKEQGQEKLIAHYSRMKDLGTRLEHGFVLWDDATHQFQYIKQLPPADEWRFLDGHPIRWTEKDSEYLAGGYCFPVVRVAARLERILEPSAYEALTCLNARQEVVYDARGAVLYKWQKELPPITSKTEAELVKRGKLKPQDARFLPRDSEGNLIELHGGSVTFSPFRKKWILVANRSLGKDSLLGEVYYSEANTPVGPFRHAVKIITHDKYTFYNPVHHPFLDTDGGRVIYFEGTYSADFSGNSHPTPRYDYNQILYRLDLSDSRLNGVR